MNILVQVKRVLGLGNLFMSLPGLYNGKTPALTRRTYAGAMAGSRAIAGGILIQEP